MARKSIKEKYNKLLKEEELAKQKAKELNKLRKEHEKELMDQLQRDIGKIIMEEWEVNDDSIAGDIIRKFKPQAMEYLNNFKDKEHVN